MRTFHYFPWALLCDFSKTAVAKVQPVELCGPGLCKEVSLVDFAVWHKPLFKTPSVQRPPSLEQGHKALINMVLPEEQRHREVKIPVPALCVS